jgi:hypothetical protein
LHGAAVGQEQGLQRDRHGMDSWEYDLTNDSRPEPCNLKTNY